MKKLMFLLIAVVMAISTGCSKDESDKSTIHVNAPSQVEQTQTPTIKPTQTPTQAPTQVPEPDYIKAGMYKIGTDLEAGEYVITSDGMAYLAVTKDSTGKFESIIANENIINRAIITVKDDQYLEVIGGKIYPFSDAPKVDTTSGKLPDGTYKVGIDIPGGEYKVAAQDGMGYFAVLKDSSGVLYSIVANSNFEGEKYVTVKDGQYLQLKGATLIMK